jgi:hypothetical protein
MQTESDLIVCITSFALYNVKPDSSVDATWIDAGAEISVMVQCSA